ncbi:MAG: hypothetical protein SNH35_07695 [Rikenellaceae bacterium]
MKSKMIIPITIKNTTFIAPTKNDGATMAKKIKTHKIGLDLIILNIVL